MERAKKRETATEPKRSSIQKVALTTYLVSVSAHGDAESTGKTEISKLDHAILVDEQVLGLQIAMQNSVRMAVRQTGQKLVHVALVKVFS